MTKYFCDLCNKELEERFFIVKVRESFTEKPTIPELQVCAKCKEDLRHWIDIRKVLGISGGGTSS